MFKKNKVAKRKISVLLMFVLVMVSKICVASEQLETVPSVDLQKYIGKWYEIASIPQSFQKQCVSGTTAEYSLAEDGLIRIINSCTTLNGSRSIAEGRARIEDTQSNSKLRVTFVKFIDWIFRFGGNYWIIDLADDYSYAVVGDPTRQYAWILSRTPVVSLNLLAHLEAKLKLVGYDTHTIMTSIQPGGVSSRLPLDEAVKGVQNFPESDESMFFL